MLNNTSFGNVTVVVANENSNLKEDKNMMNNTNGAAVVFGIAKEEVAMKTKDQLREMLEMVGVTMSNNEFKKTKKAELVAMVEQYVDESKKVEAVAEEVKAAAPVVPAVGTVNVVETKEETVMVEKNMKYEKLMKAIAKEVIAQTLVRNKEGKLVMRDWALFFKPTKAKVETKNYLVKGDRLWGVVSSVIGKVYGEQYKTEEYINMTLDQMVAWNMLTKVCGQRTYATLTPADMSDDEKSTLNDLWRTKDITTEKTKDGKVKVTAVTDNGKKVLNELYPCWTYQATAEQMTETYNLQK